MRKWLVIALSIIVSNVGLAQQESEPVHRLSLQQAVEYALQNAAEVKNARLDIEYADKDIKEVVAGGLPQINGTVNYQNYPALPTQLIPAEFFGGQPGEFAEIQFGTKHNFTAGVNANQMLYNGSFFVGLKSAELYKELTRKQLQQTEDEIAATVTKAYYTALVAIENRALLQQSLDNITKIWTETKALYENGFVEQIDVDRLELSRSNVETQLANLQRQIQLSRHLLKFQMGMPLSDSILLTDNLNELAEADPALLTADLDVLSKPEFQVLQLQTELTEMNIKNIKSMYLPSANLFANYDYMAQRNEFNFLESNQGWYNSFLWGVSVNIPIFDSFKKSSQIQQEKVNVQKLENLQTQLQNGLRLELLQAKTAYANALAQLETQHKNLALAEKIYNTATIKYNEGVGSSLEVNDAESTLFTTQTNYINALYDLVIAKTDLLKALGKF